jgi:hypothetical protein
MSVAFSRVLAAEDLKGKLLPTVEQVHIANREGFYTKNVIYGRVLCYSIFNTATFAATSQSRN